MKILITGVNGIIGSSVYKSLVENNEVLGIGTSDYSNVCSNYMKVDISDNKAVEEYLNANHDIDIIIHSAALAHNKGTDKSFEGFKKVNFNGTKYLVDGANKYLKNFKRFIFFSTISVYGEKMDKDKYIEEDECFPKSPYAVTKKMSEDYLASSAKFDYSILRFAPVYSKNFTLNIDRRTKIKGILYNVSGGKFKLSLCNINNIVEVCRYLVNNFDKGRREIYNISDERVYTYSELIDLIKANKKVINIPGFLVHLLYVANKAVKSQFIYENSIKLTSDNIYSSEKISKLVTMQHDISLIRMI